MTLAPEQTILSAIVLAAAITATGVFITLLSAQICNFIRNGKNYNTFSSYSFTFLVLAAMLWGIFYIIPRL